MSRYKQYITEIMDKPAKYKLVKDGAEIWYARFQIEDKQFAFKASLQPSDIWEIEFHKGKYGSDYDITNLGLPTALQIFATIKAILIEWIGKAKPDTFQFAAKEPSRIKLYDKFAVRITQSTPYKLTVGKTWEGKIYTFTTK